MNKFKYFYPEKPQLVTIESPLIEEWSGDFKWVAEMKYNGQRLQLHWIDNEFRFYNRRGTEMTTYVSQFDNNLLDKLSEWGSRLPNGYCLFDGELRHNKVIGTRSKIILYDVFIWDDELLVSKNFHQRREVLISAGVVLGGEPIGIIHQFSSDFSNLFTRIQDYPEIEGIVMKRLDGKLNLSTSSCKKSVWMYKIRKKSGIVQH